MSTAHVCVRNAAHAAPRHALRPRQERVVHHHVHGAAVLCRLRREERVQRLGPGRLEPLVVGGAHPPHLVGPAAVAAVGEDGDVHRARGRPGGVGDEAGRRQGAPDAAVAGEPLAELEQRVDVALDRERDEEDVDACLVRARRHGYSNVAVCG